MYGMMFVSWLPVIPASMVVVFLFVAINVLYRALSTPPGLPRDNNGVCGSCNYRLGTLAGHRCPECGADLLKCGVMTRWMLLRARGSTVGAISAWSVLVFSVAGTVLAVWGTAVMMQSLSGNITATPDYTQVMWIAPPTEWDLEDRVLLGDDIRFGLEYTTKGGGMEIRSDMGYRILLEQASIEQASIEINGDGSWILKDRKGKKIDEGDDLSLDLLDRFFGMLSMPVSDDHGRAYADQSWVYTRAFMRTTDFNEAWLKMHGVVQSFPEQVRMDRAGSTYAGSTAMMAGIPSFPFAIWAPVFYSFAGLVTVWVAGVVYIVRRRTKMMRV
ncbi:MAG: hypothetical protein JKY96_05815 [Phycisphaerales bacterium]|nr:hypothetical protein [Phycisphaerales bacterium]